MRWSSPRDQLRLISCCLSCSSSRPIKQLPMLGKCTTALCHTSTLQKVFHGTHDAAMASATSACQTASETPCMAVRSSAADLVLL